MATLDIQRRDKGPSGNTRRCHSIGGTWKQVAILDIQWRDKEASGNTRQCHFIGGTRKQVTALDTVISLEGQGSKWQH